jgi:hypothetical protein
MLFLAHMGIGSRLVKPWTQSLPKWALLLGTMLPDLVDKPLYYFLLFYSRMMGTDMGLLNNSRTIGHTALFLLAFTAIAMMRRSRLFAALALGIATHLILDNLNDGLVDYFFPDLNRPAQNSAKIALLWPFLQSYFPHPPFTKFSEHMSRSFNPLNIGFEVIGAAILFWDWWQTRHEFEIRQFFALRRIKRHEHEYRRKKAAMNAKTDR